MNLLRLCGVRAEGVAGAIFIFHILSVVMELVGAGVPCCWSG